MRKVRLLFILLILVSLFNPSIGRTGELLYCHKKTGECYLAKQNPKYNIEFIGERNRDDYEKVYINVNPIYKLNAELSEEEGNEMINADAAVNMTMMSGLRFFKQTEEYSNGMKKATYTGYGSNKDTIVGRHGTYTKWYENGEKKFEANYRYGLAHGKATLWNENGIKREESTYVDGKRHGISKIYDEHGNLEFKDTYQAGKKINRKAFDSAGKLIFDQNY
jgi:antitoxin component YwqK of YwqJK toxin-antitoxin module